MYAIRVNQLGEPDVLELEKIAIPEPGADQVLVKIAAIGVNPVDTYIRAGYQGYDPCVPYTPGFDAAGIIEKVGENIKSFVTGSRVYLAGSVSGTYAEYALCQNDQVYPLPNHISYVQGASLFVAYVTAYRGLVQRAATRPGETILIHGASGAVGIAAIQFAKNLGLNIIATTSTEDGQKLAADQGANLVLDHSNPEHFSMIMDYTEGKGVNVILEMMANQNLANDLKILSPNGRVVIIGNRDTIEINPRDLMACDGTILGVSLMNISHEDQQEIHAAIQAGLESNTLIPVIRCELKLEEAALAHQLIMQPGSLGKIILTP